MQITRLFRRFRERALNLLRPKIVFAAAILIVLIALPFGARAQLGLDPCCAIISVGLNTISSLLSNVVAKPLGTIQQTEQQTSNFEQQVIYPATAIANAKGLVTQVLGQLRQVGQLYQIPTNSATLPTPQQLEQAVLSHNPQAFGQITQSYGSLYGNVMPATDAPQPVRDLVDMTDAEAQAATWLVRSNAYTQSAMAELVRLRSIALANNGAGLKFNTTDTGDLRKSVGRMLGQE